MPSLFDIDDIVKCIDPDGQDSYLTEGKEYKVLRLNDGMIELCADSGFDRFFNEDRFELILNTSIKKFNVGDIVINVDDSEADITIGVPYKVIGFDREDNSIDFLDDAGDRRTRNAEQYATFDEYVKILQVKVQDAKKVLHEVGDKFTYHNDIYTVIETTVNNKKLYALMCDSGDIWTGFKETLRIPNNFRKLK